MLRLSKQGVVGTLLASSECDVDMARRGLPDRDNTRACVQSGWVIHADEVARSWRNKLARRARTLA